MLTIILGDITKESVDAIVNAANTSLLGGGGVDGAIHRAAGPELLAECRTLHGCETGQAKITKGYRLPAKYVIHTPGPIWRGGIMGEEQLLQSCYENCLRLAAENRFPLEKASEISARTILKFLEAHPDMEVRMVCFDGETLGYYERALKEQTEIL